MCPTSMYVIYHIYVNEYYTVFVKWFCGVFNVTICLVLCWFVIFLCRIGVEDCVRVRRHGRRCWSNRSSCSHNTHKHTLRPEASCTSTNILQHAWMSGRYVIRSLANQRQVVIFRSFCLYSKGVNTMFAHCMMRQCGFVFINFK